MWLDELIAVSNADRVTAAVAAAFGAKAERPPLPDEVRDRFDEVLEAELTPATDGLSSHDKELYAALGIGR